MLTFTHSMSNLFTIIVSLVIQNNVQAYRPDPASPIEIANVTPNNITIYCIEKDSIDGEIRQQNIINSKILKNSVVQVGIANRDDYDLADFGESQYCEFEMLYRGYNCAILWSSDKLCVWENPEVVLSRNRYSEPHPPNCPICDEKAKQGHQQCRWRVEKDEVYVSQYDIHRGRHRFVKKADWDEEFLSEELVNEYNISIRNNLEDELILSGQTAEGTKGLLTLPPRKTIKYSLVRGIDDEFLYTWICHFRVPKTGASRNGVVLWIPPPYDSLSPIRCIDCAWKADSDGIWLDSSGCGRVGPSWIKMHDWLYHERDSVEKYSKPSKRPRREHQEL